MIPVLKNAEFLSNAFVEMEGAVLRISGKLEKGVPDNKDLHALRVCIKKMRAVVLLLWSMEHLGFSAQQFGEGVKMLFKSAGKLRELYLNRDALKKYRFSKQSQRWFRENIKTRIRKRRKKLRYCARDFEAAQLEQTTAKVTEICASMPVSDLRAAAKQLIHEKIGNILKLASGDPNAVVLHRIRIQLRIVTTLGYLFQDAGLPLMRRQGLERFKALEQMLGTWHDLRVLSVFVKKSIAKLPDVPSRDECGAVIKSIKTTCREHAAVIKSKFRKPGYLGRHEK
jgi:CHAD domain-containing protein